MRVPPSRLCSPCLPSLPLLQPPRSALALGPLPGTHVARCLLPSGFVHMAPSQRGLPRPLSSPAPSPAFFLFIPHRTSSHTRSFSMVRTNCLMMAAHFVCVVSALPSVLEGGWAPGKCCEWMSVEHIRFCCSGQPYPGPLPLPPPALQPQAVLLMWILPDFTHQLGATCCPLLPEDHFTEPHSTSSLSCRELW